MVTEKTRKPSEGWKQLNFKTYAFLPGPKCAAVFFFLLFVFSSILTSVILTFSYQIIEKKASFTGNFINGQSTAVIDLDSDISGDVYIYLEYLDYYQNHRIYLKSKSKLQMSGKYDSSLSSDCEPFENNGDINIFVPIPPANQTVEPCGLMPLSFINISMIVFNNESQLSIDSSNINWPTDDSNKYIDLQNQYLKTTNPHFKVWMRSGLTNTFRKLYGKIIGGVSKGTLVITIWNTTQNYLQYTSEMNAIISTTTRIGGKNMVLGYTFLVVAGASLLWTLIFCVLIKFHRYPSLKEFYQRKKETSNN